MTPLMVRVELERIIRDQARKRRVPVPEITDAEVAELCAECMPDRMQMFRFVSNKMRRA
tara:strand:+ start:124 stop:300 length:177 start_codon:yes stop_codon:yes gene_type:complete